MHSEADLHCRSRVKPGKAAPAAMHHDDILPFGLGQAPEKKTHLHIPSVGSGGYGPAEPARSSASEVASEHPQQSCNDADSSAAEGPGDSNSNDDLVSGSDDCGLDTEHWNSMGIKCVELTGPKDRAHCHFCKTKNRSRHCSLRLSFESE